MKNDLMRIVGILLGGIGYWLLIDYGGWCIAAGVLLVHFSINIQHTKPDSGS